MHDWYYALSGHPLLTTATSCSTSAASVMLPSASFSRASLRVSRALSISTKICTAASRMLHACGPHSLQPELMQQYPSTAPSPQRCSRTRNSSLDNISEMPSTQRCSKGNGQKGCRLRATGVEQLPGSFAFQSIRSCKHETFCRQCAARYASRPSCRVAVFLDRRRGSSTCEGSLCPL